MYYLYISEQSLRSLAADITAITPEVEIITEAPEGSNVYLQLDHKGLAIISPEFKPTYVRDLYSKLLQRLKILKQELLLQAIKVKGLSWLNIWDITAGLGRDAILMANAGHKVTLIERNPALAVILNYIIQNKIVPGTENLQLIHMNSMDYLALNPAALPQVIYLDPMFQDNHSAKSKKDMQLIDLLLRTESIHNPSPEKLIVSSGFKMDPSLCWDDTPVAHNENINLFNLAYKIALNKVIVKRDNKQQTLLESPQPSYSKMGKTIRYDVYFK